MCVCVGGGGGGGADGGLHGGREESMGKEQLWPAEHNRWQFNTCRYSRLAFSSVYTQAYAGP